MSAINVKSALRMLTIGTVALLLAGGSVMARGNWNGGGGRWGGGGGYHGGGYHGGGYNGGYHSGWNYGSGYYPHYWGFNHSHYWGGFYLGSSWFWGPTVIVAGAPYYYYDGWYYTPSGDNLVVAQPPVATVQQQAPAAQQQAAPAEESSPATIQTPVENPKAAEKGAETVTLNVPNAKGGFTPVVLVKTEKGYVGPQGELYPTHPTIAQLKVLYGG